MHQQRALFFPGEIEPGDGIGQQKHQCCIENALTEALVNIPVEAILRKKLGEKRIKNCHRHYLAQNHQPVLPVKNIMPPGISNKGQPC